MVQLSDDLTWLIVGKRNAFTRHVKSSPTVFTTEKGNIMALPRQKYCMAMSKAVGATDDGKGNTTLTFVTKAAGNKPVKSLHHVKLNAYGRGTAKTSKTTKKLLADQYYRSDVTRDALARIHATAKAARRKSAGVKYTPKSRSSKK